MPSKDRENPHVEDDFIEMITTAIIGSFTASVACLILFRSIRTTLGVVKLLLFFILASNLLQVGASVMLYYASYDHYNKKADLGIKFYHAYAVLSGLGMLFIGFV